MDALLPATRAMTQTEGMPAAINSNADQCLRPAQKANQQTETDSTPTNSAPSPRRSRPADHGPATSSGITRPNRAQILRRSSDRNLATNLLQRPQPPLHQRFSIQQQQCLVPAPSESFAPRTAEIRPLSQVRSHISASVHASIYTPTTPTTAQSTQSPDKSSPDGTSHSEHADCHPAAQIPSSP